MGLDTASCRRMHVQGLQYHNDEDDAPGVCEINWPGHSRLDRLAESAGQVEGRVKKRLTLPRCLSILSNAIPRKQSLAHHSQRDRITRWERRLMKNGERN